MKNLWKAILLSVTPMLQLAGQHYIELDENNTGTDDAKGIILVWLPNLFSALVYDKPLPQAPKPLQLKAPEIEEDCECCGKLRIS